MCPDSSAHGGPNDDQQLPQPYRGEHSPVAPLDDSIQPQGEQHGEEQQTGVDQELTATGKRERETRLTVDVNVKKQPVRILVSTDSYKY